MKRVHDPRRLLWLAMAGPMLGVVLLVWVGDVAAQDAQPKEKTIATGVNIREYIVKGYSAVGPIRIDAVKHDKIELFCQPRNILVALKLKNIRVMTPEKDPRTLGDLKVGMPVYVFQTKKDVIILMRP